MSSGSGSGSGADEHLLALLRAIRLRQAAPDAVAAGAADAAAALTEMGRRAADEQRPELPAGSGDPAPGPATGGEVRPRWAAPPPVSASPWAGSSPPPGSSPQADYEADADGDFEFDRLGDEPADESVATTLPGRDFFGRPQPSSEQRSPSGPAREAGPGREAGSGQGFVPWDVAGAGSSRDESASRAGGLVPGMPEAYDEVGQLSRNRFSGLPPVRKAVEIRKADSGRADKGRAVEEPAPGRPRWASGEPGVVPPLPGPQAPRVPGLDLPYVVPPMVPASGRAAEAHDGMDPADDELLRETQRLLSTSLTFAGGPDEVAERFRAALVQAQPALMAAVPGDEGTQTALLSAALTWLVHHLDRPPLVVDGCRRLGAALAACGVAPHQMHLVGAALAEAMRAGMPPGAWRQDFDLAWRSTWQHAYEWIAHGEALAAREPVLWTAVVVSHELRRHDLAVIRLRPLLPMPFRPGQYARVEVPELPGTWRPYSLSGAPRRDDIIELHVRAKTQSGVSGTLVYRTRVGDRVRLSRAEGSMGLPETADRNLLMIAGDTGVAPLKALLIEMADTDDPRSAVLFWGVRTRDELYDIDEITEIARAARRATIVPVVSEGNPGPYASGLVTDAVAAYGEWSGHEVYLAGPPLMLTATSAALHQLGVAPDHIHHDAPE